jgi:hypothetical protein
MYKNSFIKKLFLQTLILGILLSCNKAMEVSLSVEKEKILELHNLQRDYHFNKDSVAFVNQLSDNFISVNKGKITSPKREETLRRYHQYFSSVEFIKWDDVTPPIIKFSDDRSLAYCIVDKIVLLTYMDENKNKIEQETHFAWTTIYRKYGKEWKIDSVISTEKP